MVDSKSLAQMIYGIVCFAMFFSFTGTVLGGIWADSAFIPYNEIGGITWREGEHDDLVIAVALACWAGERLVRKITRVV